MISNFNFKKIFLQLYDLDGKTYNEEEVMQIYYQATMEFKEKNPTFIGAKIIYAPVRVVADDKIPELMQKVRNLHEKFPTFLAGFDLVGQEDKGRPLIDFSKEILKLPSTINFYFHAGETNWNGLTDDNLVRCDDKERNPFLKMNYLLRRLMLFS